MSEWVPELGPKVIPAHVEELTVRGVLNPLPIGTRVRATLGETVIVGTTQRPLGSFPLVLVRIDPVEDDSTTAHYLDVNLWITNGWRFEVLAEAVA